jgi:hypothetical protein
VGVSRNRARRNAIRPGHGTAVPLRHTERAWFIGTCTLPAGNVGATRWVARRRRCTYGRRVGSHAAAVHGGGAATHRVAPTRRAYSRVRGANEHGTAADQL